MAKEEEKAKSQDKGKGRAEDAKQVNGVKGTKESGKDGKDKSVFDLPPEELNEEDQ